ncbi:MAG: nucleotidyl transferase AbiEii/AbiGii toxin family protein [Deltaproteobacteria bacterium]|nr:nucleotidyl transferase AbiEii/AbiGii toxin family protein [Deltaproteobacteria bacterium]
MIKKFATPKAFRTSLEERLKTHSRKTGIELQRLRRQVAFDRLLFRLFQFFPKDLLLKGGYAMELRLEGARATKDIDLVLKATRVGSTGNSDHVIRRMLQDAVQKDSGDFFEFLVGEPTLDLEAVPYGGSRYPIEQIESEDWLGFAGIETLPFPAISREQQFAEKLHAYTSPREESENSRVKDLIDLVLLIVSGGLKTAIGKVFEYRATHEAPKTISHPPANWKPKFDRLAKECGLDCDLAKAFEQVEAFIGGIFR